MNTQELEVYRRVKQRFCDKCKKELIITIEEQDDDILDFKKGDVHYFCRRCCLYHGAIKQKKEYAPTRQHDQDEPGGIIKDPKIIAELEGVEAVVPLKKYLIKCAVCDSETCYGNCCEKEPRKIIQIQAVNGSHGQESYPDNVYALCNDGTLWIDATNGKWDRLPTIPQGEVKL